MKYCNYFPKRVPKINLFFPLPPPFLVDHFCLRWTGFGTDPVGADALLHFKSKLLNPIIYVFNCPSVLMNYSDPPPPFVMLK